MDKSLGRELARNGPAPRSFERDWGWNRRNDCALKAVVLGGDGVSVREMPREELRQEIKAGRLCHSLALVALAQVFDLWPDSDAR